MKPVLFLHEIRRNMLSLVVWSAVMAFTLGVCIIIYPEMQSQMNEISDMFANMGSFSQAFGMDQINFGEFMGYFGVECGNTLGMGGAMLAGIVGILALSKEERDSTAELLLTLPVSRIRIITEKLLFAIFHIFAVNLVVALVCIVGAFAVGVEFEISEMLLILLAYFLMQLEITAITFGLSSVVKKGGIGIGIGVGFAFYFLGILSKLADSVEFVKYLTPFGFADSAYILSEGKLEIAPLLIGFGFSALGIAFAYYYYNKKDIA